MSHLVSNDIGHAPDVPQAGMLRVQKQGCFTIREKAPVFHCSSSKVRNANQVQFGEGEGDAEERLKGRKHFGGDFQGCCQIPSPAWQ